MATIVYDYKGRCEGGGHFSVDVSLDGGNPQHFVFATDEVRAPMSSLTQDQRQFLAFWILRLHFADQTRAEMGAQLQAGPVTVTI